MKNLITPKNFTVQEYLNQGSRSVMPVKDRQLLIEDFEKLTTEEQQRNLSVLFALQPVRERFGKPIFITCGYRSLRHELSRNRSGKSQHLFGAVDLTCNDMRGLALQLDDWNGGYKWYVDRKFIHIDLGRKRRW